MFASAALLVAVDEKVAKLPAMQRGDSENVGNARQTLVGITDLNKHLSRVRTCSAHRCTEPHPGAGFNQTLESAAEEHKCMRTHIKRPLIERVVGPSMRLPGCPFYSAWCLVGEVCRLTVDCVDCRCFLSFVFLGGARRLELSPCNTYQTERRMQGHGEGSGPAGDACALRELPWSVHAPAVGGGRAAVRSVEQGERGRAPGAAPVLQRPAGGAISGRHPRFQPQSRQYRRQGSYLGARTRPWSYGESWNGGVCCWDWASSSFVTTGPGQDIAPCHESNAR